MSVLFDTSTRTGGFIDSAWTNSDKLLEWLFDCIQDIYVLIVGNWVLYMLFTIGILGLVIALFKKLLSPVNNTKKS